jgi:hypothetical protein
MKSIGFASVRGLMLAGLTALCACSNGTPAGTTSGSTGTSTSSVSTTTSGGASSSSGTSTGGTTSSSSTGTSTGTTGDGVYHVYSPDGIDGDSCGSIDNPCLTVTQAMANVASDGTLGATIHVAMADAGTQPVQWPAPEVWPLRLGYGVTLLASDQIVFFNPGPIFHITPYGVGTADALTVTIDSLQLGGVGSTVGVDIQDMSVQLSDVQIGNVQLGVHLRGASNLIFGPNPVLIGSNTSTATGVLIESGTVTDVCDGGIVLTVYGAQNDMIVSGGSTVLSCPVVIGASLNDAGQCPANPNLTGLTVGQTATGKPTVALLGGATIRCHALDGLALVGSGTLLLGNDGGTVTGAISTVELSGCAGADVIGGTLLASNTSFIVNHYGVIQRAMGVAGIGSGALNPDGTSCAVCTGNTVACNSNAVMGNCTSGNGRDLWANSANTLHAEGVALGTNGPASYVCTTDPPQDQSPTGCACDGGGCHPLTSTGNPPDKAQTLSSPSSVDLVALGSATMTFVCP